MALNLSSISYSPHVAENSSYNMERLAFSKRKAKASKFSRLYSNRFFNTKTFLPLMRS